jgi:hypothetical protein
MKRRDRRTVPSGRCLAQLAGSGAGPSFPTRPLRRDLSGRKGLLRGPRQIRHDEIVRFPQQNRHFSWRQSIPRFDGNPLGSCQIRRRDNPRPLDQIGKFLRVGLQGEPDARRLQRNYHKHSAAHFEEQVVFPLNLLGDSGEGKAKFPQLVDIHGAASVPPNLALRKFEISECEHAGKLRRRSTRAATGGGRSKTASLHSGGRRNQPSTAGAWRYWRFQPAAGA